MVMNNTCKVKSSKLVKFYFILNTSWTQTHHKFELHKQVLIQKQLSFLEFIVKQKKKNEKKKESCLLALKSCKRKMIKVAIFLKIKIKEL